MTRSLHELRGLRLTTDDELPARRDSRVRRALPWIALYVGVALAGLAFGMAIARWL